ncbi:YHYH domain-containing protein [Neorhizobium galegae]
MKPTITAVLLALSLIVSASTASAHGGGLDKNGCHHDNKNGGSHCH